ncbi:chemotaxis protein CheW [Thalassobaculum sp. OXR-137]|uniref:hybrid sensor histidine kinase/response regulator n=1 Tax=Thalassobaculum sp. OXR-137 TaxID=3100173 RepID=UPI002AC99FB6|nr:chemotaxis protein CheW [Thalassobaculum sp. OXR-137]WPZ33560.1 chemotaxis protein CheW [Thalassobaculum sp. OXR-137]
MDELLSEFLTETAEGLAELDVEIVKLEQNPNDAGLIASIFRIVHTIKGTCGFIGLPRLETVAHAAENVLGKYRDKELEVTPTSVTVILASLDRIKSILAHIEQTEQEPEGSDEDLIEQLNELAEGRTPTAAPAAPAAPAAAVANDPEAAADATMETLADADLDAPIPGGDVIGTRPGEVPLDELERAFMEAPGPEETPAAAEFEPELPAAPPSVPAIAEKAPETSSATAEAMPIAESKAASQNIRVNVDLLENLMTMVSELVLTRNQLLQIARSNGREIEGFSVPLQRLSQVTSELQEGVMKTRMQPIGNAWSKLPRIVRDLAHELNKKIELVMQGADTELDRQVLEMIKDPLTHMVRNSADHGVEDPATRLAFGKSETGHIRLNAYHEGGHIIIEIADDGKGIDPEKIRAKAIEKNVVGSADAANMSDQQILQLIFKAGFSTAEKITSVSGRGVGMDVVKTNIEKIGGTVDLTSQVGKGSVFKIKIPLTLAIVSALVVASSSERFAIPQLSVLELVKTTTDGPNRIETVQGTRVMRLRDRLLPLVSLRDLLRLDEGKDTADTTAETFVVVMQVGTYSFGLLVDKVFDTEEIVVKPVAPVLRDLTVFSGNTILGDGSVIMILDPNGIAQETGEVIVPDQADYDGSDEFDMSLEEQTLLLFKSGDDGPKAVPLSLVARIEMLDLKTVEHSEGRPLVQYRGSLMPLVICKGAAALAREGQRPALVFTDDGKSMGLVVDEILDVVEDRIDVTIAPDGAGMMGSAIIKDKATDIVDAGFYLTEAFGDWFRRSRQGKENTSKRRLLLVDDSAFFRNLMTPLLATSGYKVVPVDSAQKALDLCEAGANFDLIVTDIEMPDMDGFTFAEKLKETAWADTPVVALSSRTSEQDLERGHQVGFADYVAKSDRDALLDALPELLKE